MSTTDREAVTHPATKPNGECSDPDCECHVLATKTGKGEHLELRLRHADNNWDAFTKSQQEQYRRSCIRSAIFDVLDAGDPRTQNRAWLFLQVESDMQTERRTRFVDQVCKRLEEL